jgi:hypothetical protein
MTTLCDLAYKYGSDKCPQIKHHYTGFYYELFKDRRDSVRKVVEIGVGCRENMNDYPGYRTGASLYMWRDFFPNAMIYGADILPELVFKDGRIETFQCDQSVRSDLLNLIKKTGPDIDLFIDDGSHKPDDQVFACLTVMPMLDEGTTYVIEDVGKVGIIHSLDCYDCQRVSFKDRVSRDDRLIVVRKKGV